MNAGVSLTELSDTLLLGSCQAAATPLSSHLLQAFGEDQLPAVAAYQQTGSAADTQQQASLDSAMQEKWESLKGQGIFDAYLSWVHETLLMVINEVVSSNQPDPC
jgi:hypothetical protein